MALLGKYYRSMGDIRATEARSGNVLRSEAKAAPAWALSSEGVAGKTYDDHGVRRVRVSHIQDIVQGGRVVASCERKEGDCILREIYSHSKFGVGATVDARRTDVDWYVLLDFGLRETWVALADCTRGHGGSVSFRPGRSEGARIDRQTAKLSVQRDNATAAWGTRAKKR